MVRKRYDLIVLDTPPVNSVADAAMLTRHCDAVLFVARAGVTSRDALVFAMELLRLKTGIEMTHLPYKGAAPAGHAAWHDGCTENEARSDRVGKEVP